MPETSSDPLNPIPSNANDEINKLRESIPAKDRCSICDGFGMIMDRFLRTYRVCKQCDGTGRRKLAKSNPPT